MGERGKLIAPTAGSSVRVYRVCRDCCLEASLQVVTAGGGREEVGACFVE